MLHQPITTEAEAVARRSYTVAYNHLYERRGMPWMLRKYGHGHWVQCSGEPAYYATEEAAHEAGRFWNTEGRDQAGGFYMRDYGI